VDSKNKKSRVGFNLFKVWVCASIVGLSVLTGPSAQASGAPPPRDCLFMPSRYGHENCIRYASYVPPLMQPKHDNLPSIWWPLGGLALFLVSEIGVGILALKACEPDK
jgi:hypothetical protein